MNKIEYHVISAKRFGWKDMYDHFFFLTSEYNEYEALAQFEPVEKTTEKNGRVFPYISYEFNGETFFSVAYRGIATQQEYDDFKDE